METWSDYGWFCLWILATTALFGLASLGLLFWTGGIENQWVAGFAGIAATCCAIPVGNIGAWWQRDRRFRRDLDTYASEMHRHDTYPGSYTELRERLRDA